MKKKINLNLFGYESNVQTTNSTGLSDEMKVFYSDYLLDFAKPELVHDQFSLKKPIPNGKGKTVEFRKYSPLPKALTPLQEGVTPNGNSLNVTTINATAYQYGDFICVSDVLTLTAIDNNIAEATELLGDQAGRTIDTIVRECLNGGTNRSFSGGVAARHLLVGGSATEGANNYLTVNDVKLAVRKLKSQNAKRINGAYVGIINPDVSYDLRNDENWKYPHQYADTQEIYEGEIGMIEGVRFVETTEAKIFHAADLSAANRTLTVASYSNKVITISQTLTADDRAALVGRKILVSGQVFTVVSATANSITINETPATNPAANNVVYPGEAGAEGRDIYSTLIIGDKAYGTCDLEGGGLEHIFKPLGSAGAGDPLNQRATAGWKTMFASVRLVENNIVRIESASTFEGGEN